MLSLAFADIDCLFSPNQGITLPIKKEELKYLASFLFLLDSTKYLEVFYSFTEDKRDKKKGICEFCQNFYAKSSGYEWKVTNCILNYPTNKFETFQTISASKG